MRKTNAFLRAALALLLAVTLLPVGARAAAAQEIRGVINASALQNGAEIRLTGDTVLTLDGNKTVQRIGYTGSVKPTLTVRGTGTLTVTAGVQVDTLVLESGTLKCSAAAGSSDSGLRAREVRVTGGVLDARDGGDDYGVKVAECMTVTGGTVTGTGQFSGVHARQLLVSGGSVSGVGTGTGGEFDSCDGVFTEVLKISGGSVSGRGSEAGITAARRIECTEGTDVVNPADGKVSPQRMRFAAWGNDSDPFFAYTVLDKSGAAAKTAALGLPVRAFMDVPPAQYYALPVAWAAAQTITAGSGPNTFSPEAICTRAQVVTFLWRASGAPEPVGAVNAFADVSPMTYYYKAVLWAVQQGITNGTDATHFSPNATCTRGHVVTFLYRFEHSPAVSGVNPFADVRASDYFYSPVLWAVSRSITNGTSPTTFSPASGCTRGQVVTFLYRDLHRTPTPDVLTD